jgi:CO/xanthine dehydrogenase FAD-binding subunit
MRWRAAQANAKTATKPAIKPAAPAVKPTAAQGGNTQQRTTASAGNRFAQTRSIDDAVALLLAKG